MNPMNRLIIVGSRIKVSKERLGVGDVVQNKRRMLCRRWRPTSSCLLCRLLLRHFL